MQILGRLYLYLIVCCVLGFHKNFLECLLRGCILMDGITYLKQLGDFVCRILVFGILKQVFEYLGVFLLFGFGLKLLQFDWSFRGLVHFVGDFRGKSDGFCSKNDFDENFSSKCKCGWRNSNAPIIQKMEENTEKMNLFIDDDDEINITDYEECDDEKEDIEKDEELDITELRKLVKIERRRASAACTELEKERAASATAAEETMAMILRL
ncbi:protein FLOURY 1-like [Abeliophyllum distichum]|uniref:Protein FLOURY 1-like n=1 Tax=Abeliophyllum distichum TaxID=126358 RepID=A0ABD1P3B5_9LAMI